jgi:hypothetical protein
VRAVPFTGVKHGYYFRNDGRGIGYHANEKHATAEVDCAEACAKCKDFQPCCPSPSSRRRCQRVLPVPHFVYGCSRWSNWVWMSESHVVVFEPENRCCPYIELPTRSEPITSPEAPAE